MEDGSGLRTVAPRPEQRRGVPGRPRGGRWDFERRRRFTEGRHRAVEIDESLSDVRVFHPGIPDETETARETNFDRQESDEAPASMGWGRGGYYGNLEEK